MRRLEATNGDLNVITDVSQRKPTGKITIPLRQSSHVCVHALLPAAEA